MLTKIKARIIDWYLTKKTGKSKATRDYEEWYHGTVILRANTIENMLQNFTYIIEVDWNKFFSQSEPFEWVPCAKAKQFLWPAKPVDDCAVWRIDRIYRDSANHRFITDLGDQEILVVATNNKEDALIIAMLFT